MITTLLSLYTGMTLMGAHLPSPLPHTMPWNEIADEIAGENQSITVVPQKNTQYISPVIKAKSAIAVDLDSGLILYEKNIHETLPIASITKLMTSIIVLEENNLEDIITVSKNATKTIGSKIWLAAGEKITLENLLKAVLINSANDAAIALAEYNSNTTENFANKMNEKSKSLGLISSTFYNPTGLDEEITTTSTVADTATPTSPSSSIQSNTSTAYDLSLLAHYAYSKNFIRKTVIKKEEEIASVDEKITHKLTSTNDLLKSYLKVLGLKTGTTDEAGECLIAIIQNDQGHNILTVVLNSPNRYTETKLLADWTFRAYQW